MSGDGPLGFGPPDPDDRTPEPAPERDLAHREDPDLHTLRDRPARPKVGPGAIGAIALIAFVLFVSASVFFDREEGPGAAGLSAGTAAPVFSAPLVDGPTKDEFEVNVLTKETDGNPPACSVRGPNAVNACALWRDKPVVVSFFTSGNDACVQEIDLMERLRRAYPKVAFIAVSLGDDRDRSRDQKRSRGWGMPVAYDRSGALSALYGVAVCPHVTFVRRGGEVAATQVGTLDEPGFRASLDALVAGKAIPGA